MVIERVDRMSFDDPTLYRNLRTSVKSVAARSFEALEPVIRRIQILVHDVAPGATLHGRVKSVESILFKMRRNGTDLERVFDILGARVIVRSTTQCYRVLERIHDSFPFLEDEEDDYVQSPKPNGYRSLHTTILTAGAHPLEVQIRSHQMHWFALQGAAAHGQYKKTQASRNANRLGLDQNSSACRRSNGSYQTGPA